MPNALFFIHALTDLHPGSGSDLGAVDLPIQRERHTQWPTISGSAIKGVVRDSIREKLAVSKKLSLEDADKQPVICELFGPPPNDLAGDNAGAISFTDARILAFPVRSLRGTYALVTCPSVLRRFLRDARLVKKDLQFDVPKVAAKEARATGDTLIVTRNENSYVVLEEIRLAVEQKPELSNLLSVFWEDGSDLKEDFQTRLVLVPDDDFTYFVRYATTVTTRIRLKYESKTVETGALFTMETLPPETLLYSVVLASQSRIDKARDADQVLASFKGSFKNEDKCTVIQLGADETTGKGLCEVHLADTLPLNPGRDQEPANKGVAGDE